MLMYVDLHERVFIDDPDLGRRNDQRPSFSTEHLKPVVMSSCERAAIHPNRGWGLFVTPSIQCEAPQ